MLKSNKNLFIRGYLVIIFSVLLLPSITWALDQRCWVEQKCKEAEGAFYGSSEGKPNSETITACGGEKNAVGEYLGFCKPPYVAQTEVTFGNTNTFANIGEFIKFMFRYTIMAAGVVAVIMVVVAGLQWVMSGGNAEKISGAKKRIGGAMMGLFLAIMGYSVLNFINPYLVNLRLPQAWMINTQGLAPAYCDALTSSTTVATAFPVGTKKTQAEKEKMSSSADYNVKSQEAVCGTEYFVKDTGGQTCVGTFCGVGNVCAPPIDNIGGSQYNKYKCYEGNVAGIISGGALYDLKPTGCLNGLTPWGAEGWIYPWATEETLSRSLSVFCENGERSNSDIYGARFQTINFDTEKIQLYILKNVDMVDKGRKFCQEKGSTVKGYMMFIDFNEDCDMVDEYHFIGRNGVDLGDIDQMRDKNYKIKKALLIQPEQLERGTIINIDVNNVHDIDEDGDRAVYKNNNEQQF